MARRRYTPKLKAHMVLGEVLPGGKTPGQQIARVYGVHPNSVRLWKRRFIERSSPKKRRSTSTSVASGIWNSFWAGRKWRWRSRKIVGRNS